MLKNVEHSLRLQQSHPPSSLVSFNQISKKKCQEKSFTLVDLRCVYQRKLSAQLPEIHFVLLMSLVPPSCNLASPPSACIKQHIHNSFALRFAKRTILNIFQNWIKAKHDSLLPMFGCEKRRRRKRNPEAFQLSEVFRVEQNWEGEGNSRDSSQIVFLKSQILKHNKP